MERTRWSRSHALVEPTTWFVLSHAARHLLRGAGQWLGRGGPPADAGIRRLLGSMRVSERVRGTTPK